MSNHTGPVVLVTGSRGWTDTLTIAKVLLGLDPSCVVHGGARGADELAARWAQATMTPVKVYKPDWTLHGKKAGILRNEFMLLDSKPNFVVAFWDGSSRGTKHMIDFATQNGYEVRIYTCEK